MNALVKIKKESVGIIFHLPILNQVAYSKGLIIK